MKTRILIPLVALGILVLGVGFFSNLFFSPPVSYFDCAPKKLDLDVSIAGANSPNLPGLDVATFDFDMETYDIGTNYGTANGDGKVDGGYSISGAKNRLHFYAGLNTGRNNNFDLTVQVTPSTPGPPPTSPTVLVRGSIGGTVVSLSGLAVTSSNGRHSVSFPSIKGNTLTINWGCE